MNFMGIGLPEMAVILLVAFLVLGPARTVTMARTAGKVLGDLRRTFNQVAAAARLEEIEQPLSRTDSPPDSRPQDIAREPPTKPGDE